MKMSPLEAALIDISRATDSHGMLVRLVEGPLNKKNIGAAMRRFKRQLEEPGVIFLPEPGGREALERNYQRLRTAHRLL